MLKEYDRVLDKVTGKTCFVIIVDGDEGDVVYGVESEDQGDDDWFRWAEACDLEYLGD